MKTARFFLLAAAFAGSNLWAQSQRTVLLEEFTNASCPPCAAQNPALNAMLANNTAKVVSVKYQTNWPGVDPMNAQTQVWVAPRVTYYDVQGVPSVSFNGTGDLSPGDVTQTLIDDTYALPANFTITPTHTFSADLDSVFIKVVYACTSDMTAGSLDLRVALTEETIAFSAAPGTNGEKEFYNVMRQMFPNSDGTSLKTTWVAGEKDSVMFAAPIPAYIYNIWELGVVAFIQNNAKGVEQAGYSLPLPLPGNAADVTLSGISFGPLFCNAPGNADAILQIGSTSRSSGTLTSCSVAYAIDNVNKPAVTWNGSVAPGAFSPFTLTNLAINQSVGGHSARFWVEAPNGSADLLPANNSKTTAFYVASSPMAVPIFSNFTGSAWPANWGTLDPDNDKLGFAVKSGYCGIKFYDISSGLKDEMYLPVADLIGIDSAYLSFDVAAAMYNANYSDKLAVQVSEDCGATWTTVWEKSGAALATVAARTTSYSPAGAGDFRAEWVDMDAYSGKSGIVVKFVGTSDYGNNAYLDNVLLDGAVLTGTDPALSRSVTVFPNPAAQEATVLVSLSGASEVSATLTDATGKAVMAIPAAQMTGAAKLSLDVSALANGLYFLHVAVNGESVVKTVTVAH